jgi:hypothetical protein
MLRAVNVVKIDAKHCRVTIDRDGKEKDYVFSVTLPEPDEPPWLAAAGPPDEIYYDLLDYDYIPPGQRAGGAPWLLFMKTLVSLVCRTARDEPVELPVVLDER